MAGGKSGEPLRPTVPSLSNTMPNPPDLFYTFIALSAGFAFGGIQMVAARTALHLPGATLFMVILVAAAFAAQIAAPGLMRHDHHKLRSALCPRAIWLG